MQVARLCGRSTLGMEGRRWFGGKQFGRRAVLTLLLVFLLAHGSRLLGQANAGLTGTVTDASGAVVAGATVVITNQQTNVASTLVTSSAGTYALRGINPGVYRVEIDGAGFRKEIKENIPVEVSQVGTIDFTLARGATSEVIEVNADSLTLNTTQPQISTTIDPEVIDSLPVEISGRGRQIDSLQFLSPGTTGSTFSHRVSGGVDFEQEILFNGIPAPQPETQGYTTNFNPPYDLVGEVSVEQTTFSAQYGLGQGALTYQTKSGTNRYHGQLFEINRNNFFDSVGFYNSKPQGGNGQVPTDHENNYGFTVGGPISIPKVYNGHDRTFGLYSQEWYKQNQANTGTSTVPTVLEKTGNFSDYVDANGHILPIYDPLTGLPFPNNTIPASRISPAAASLLQYLPNPDRPGTGNGGLQNNKNFAANSFPNIQHVWGFTVDHKLSDRQSLHYAQWRNSYTTTTFDYSPFAIEPNPLASNKREPALGSVFLLNYVNQATPKLVITAGLGWIGEINNQFNDQGGYQSPLTTGSTVPPNINFGGGPGYTSWGTSGGWLYSINRKLGIAFSNNYLWTRGRHSFNIGYEIRRTYQDDNEQQTYGGVFNFSNNQTSVHNPADPNFTIDGNPFASYLLGLPDSVNRSNSQELALRNFDLSPYIQDDIKLTTKLTLNLGVRWDIQEPFTAKANNVVYFNPNITNPDAIGLNGAPRPGAVSKFGVPGGITRADIHYGHVGPRIGLAYALNPKTVLQAGFSIAFLDGGAYEYGTNKVAVNYGNLLVGSFTRNSTGSYTSSYGPIDGNPLPNPGPVPFSSGLGIANTVHSLNPERDGYAPYTQQWNFNVQHQLPFRTLLTAAYVGTRTIHLPSNLNHPDQLNPQYLSLQGKLGDVFLPGQTSLDGVTLPYTNFVNNFGGGATVQQALLPYPQYAGIMDNFEAYGTTFYQGLQVTVDKHLSNGLSFLVGYTLSRSLDNTSSGFTSFANGGIDKYNQSVEYSISSADEPNTLKVSGTYELPIGPGKAFLNNKGIVGELTGGWKIGWILDYEQGTPFGVGGGGTMPLNGFNRPNRNPSVPLQTNYSKVKHFLVFRNSTTNAPVAPQIFNPGAFTPSAPYVEGNAKRNYTGLRNTNYYNEAASLEKGFYLGERFRGILKVDYFNLLNRTYFGGTDTGVTDTNFGVYNGGTNGTNRQGQATFRITF